MEKNETIIPAHRQLSVLQMFAIASVANTAIRMLANRPPAPTVVRNVVERIVETPTTPQS